MTARLTAMLLKPVSPLLHCDDLDDMVYSPYNLAHHRRSSSTSKSRRSHQLSPEVRAEIVARVLDPAYSGRRDEDYIPRVFVDNRGDEHDPDYQLFPVVPVYPRHRRSQTHGFFRHMRSEEELLREEEDAESEAEWTRSRAASPFTPSASPSPSPPPHNPLSLFGDDEWDEKEWTREVVVPTKQSKRRKLKAMSRPLYIPVPEPTVTPSSTFLGEEPAYVDARQSSVQLVREDTMDTTLDETPSCGYVLRRQWATFTLHTRLSAHRIARRARRAVSVGT